MTRLVTIERLGARGEGLAHEGDRAIFLPWTVPGDVVALSDGGAMQALETPSPDRVAPICDYFTRCGGCTTQMVALPVQLHWKRDLVVAALAQAGLDAPVAPCIDSHGAGRRRATFHARRGADGHMETGFMAAGTHDLVAIDACPLFAPSMDQALPAARAVARALASTGKPLDIAVTATLQGLDIDVRGTGPLDEPQQKALIAAASRLDLARIANHGRTIIAYRTPTILVADIPVTLPPGGFLQATQAGEDTLSACVLDAAKGAKRVLDLFSGIGTFALRLARHADVVAAESDANAVAALRAAAGFATGLRALRGEQRDLVRRPLARAELNDFDAVVFDPPRAGAVEQSAELARSDVPLVVGVSCNPKTFARDAKLLVDGGYVLERVTPVDQFRHSAHVELVGIFRRAKVRKKRKLLG